MNKLIIDPHNCSRDEFAELKEYLDDKCWDYKLLSSMPKTFNIQHNIGKCKYVLNTHNGIDTHKDGSPFFGVEIFKNKIKLKEKIDRLKAAG